MYLHEEYINRKKLDIPLFLYKSRSSVFLKSKDAPHKWRILAFSWREPDRHPGYFVTDYTEVVHNGFDKGEFTKDIYNIDITYWDEYEGVVSCVVDLVKKHGYQAVKLEEQTLAAWQIFLMMYDSWLARNMDVGFFKTVGRSLDQGLTRRERESALREAQNLLGVDRRINDMWAYQILPLAKTRSEWLVRLIND